MNSFTLKGENGFIKIALEEVFDFPDKTSHWDGYDVKASLEIKSGNFEVKSSFYSTTGEIFQFYEMLKKCNEQVSGKVIYKNYEENIVVIITYDNQGKAIIEGTFSEENEYSNKLDFEFMSDQSFIKHSIKDLELIAGYYGGMKGILKDKY